MQKMFEKRRREFLAAMGDGAAVFPSAPTARRNNDVEHEYRQDSDFFYLTGFDEPGSVLLLTNQHDAHSSVLFVRKKDKEKEIWDGYRAGVSGAVTDFGVDAAFEIGEVEKGLADYLANVKRVHCRVGRGDDFDKVFYKSLNILRSRVRSGVTTPTEIVDPGAVLHEMRLHKSKEEIELMAGASKVTDEAHQNAMLLARPGMFEHELEAELMRTFRAAGAERAAYPSIVGSGPNATVLHYRRNNRKMEDGDLVLIDAGCEMNYYASDVTRTFPVNGKFTEAQRAVYQTVLDAQLACIDAVKPGVTLKDLHDVAVEVLVAGMIQMGLINDASVEDALESKSYRAFYMHRTSHWIGMDVHDVGTYFTDGDERPLEEGFALTIEPGIYIAPDAEVEAKYQGIGIRIEDDVLVTATGHHNLTKAPKTIEEVEALMAS